MAEHDTLYPGNGLHDPTSFGDAAGPNLRMLMAELNRPLDPVDWSTGPLAGLFGTSEPTADRQRATEAEHLRELERARQAARAAFGVKPGLPARMKAASLLSGMQ